MASKSVREEIDKFFDYGLYVPTRTLYIGDAGDTNVDADMARKAIMGLHILDQTVGPITIKLNTQGGDYYHGLAIYDAIRACNNEVTIIGFGYVMSMGSYILQAADHRVLAPNASLMVHYGTESFEGHGKDFDRYSKEKRRQDDSFENLLLAKIREKHPNYTIGALRKLIAFDVYLTPGEAIDLGLADSVLPT